MSKTCCIFNVAPIYNQTIYSLIDQELHYDFYIGDTVGYNIKLMDYTLLSGFKKKLRNRWFYRKAYWQEGVIKLLFKPYHNYIITGEVNCLSTWIALILGKIFRKNIYLWSHGWYGDERLIKKVIKVLFFNLSKTVLLYGDYARLLMIENGIKPNKLKCIYNSLSYDLAINIRKNLEQNENIYKIHFKNDCPVIIYIGRIQKSKRIDLLIDALEIVNKQRTCNLVLIGEDIDNIGIQPMVEKKHLSEKVWIYGECYDEKTIGKLLYNADICISPGNVGLTAIHSLTYGTPVITHNNYIKQGPEFESITEDLTGAFFKENDVIDLSNKINIWLDKVLIDRDTIRKNAYKMIEEKYNPHRQIELLKSLINQ